VGHAKLRCDYCRGHLGVSVQRYWRMRFCCTACTSEYRQRLSREPQLKILTLVTETIESGAVQLVMFSSFRITNEEPRPTQRRRALDLNRNEVHALFSQAAPSVNRHSFNANPPLRKRVQIKSPNRIWDWGQFGKTAEG
jgi:hypothetical protein